jgi:NADH-quinone oxidoreductase subunit A
MPQNYIPIFVFLLVAFMVAAGTLWLPPSYVPAILKRSRAWPTSAVSRPIDDSRRQRYTVRFYIIAILFVVFDVETIFLFPWAVQFKQLGAFGFLEMLIFLGILVLGYVWVWKKGALEWI